MIFRIILLLLGSLTLSNEGLGVVAQGSTPLPSVRQEPSDQSFFSPSPSPSWTQWPQDSSNTPTPSSQQTGGPSSGVFDPTPTARPKTNEPQPTPRSVTPSPTPMLIKPTPTPSSTPSPPIITKYYVEPSALKATESTRSVASVSAILSVASGPPSFATASKSVAASLIGTFFSCGISDAFDLDFTSHPVGVSVGTTPLSTYLGAVVCNCALCIGFFGIYCITEYFLSSRSQRSFSMPGHGVLLLLFFFQSLAFIGARMTLHGGGSGVIHTVGVGCLVGLLMFTVWCANLCRRGCAQSPQYRIIFEAYNHNFLWFAVIELLFQLVLGAVTAYSPTSEIHCDAELGLISALHVVHGFLLWRYRPLLNVYEFWVTMIVDGLNALASVCIALGGNAAIAGNIILMISGIVLAIFALVTLGFAIRNYLSGNIMNRPAAETKELNNNTYVLMKDIKTPGTEKGDTNKIFTSGNR
eukprot:PhF_6_TR11018/c0_g1_i1/m.17843